MSQGKTAMSHLQEPERLLAACVLLPEELCESLSVQFVGDNRDAVRNDQSLQVSARGCSLLSHGLFDTTRTGPPSEKRALMDELSCRRRSRRSCFVTALPMALKRLSCLKTLWARGRPICR